jgi:hypothetical protein
MSRKEDHNMLDADRHLSHCGTGRVTLVCDGCGLTLCDRHGVARSARRNGCGRFA